MGNDPLEPKPTDIVCSCVAKIRASLNLPIFFCKSDAISACVRFRLEGSTKLILGCDVFTPAPEPPYPEEVRAMVKSPSGTESFKNCSILSTIFCME